MIPGLAIQLDSKGCNERIDHYGLQRTACSLIKSESDCFDKAPADHHNPHLFCTALFSTNYHSNILYVALFFFITPFEILTRLI